MSWCHRVCQRVSEHWVNRGWLIAAVAWCVWEGAQDGSGWSRWRCCGSYRSWPQRRQWNVAEVRPAVVLLFMSTGYLVIQLFTFTTALSMSVFHQFIEQNVMFNERSHLWLQVNGRTNGLQNLIASDPVPIHCVCVCVSISCIIFCCWIHAYL